MLRVTMTSTMPVAMTATDDDWTDKFQRLRGVRKSPSEKTWKPSQMTSSAPIMPSMRVSSSVAFRKPAMGPSSVERARSGDAVEVASDMGSSPWGCFARPSVAAVGACVPRSD